MAKYSDHSTIGGQVLAHRIRMIKQNAKRASRNLCKGIKG